MNYIFPGCESCSSFEKAHRKATVDGSMRNAATETARRMDSAGNSVKALTNLTVKLEEFIRGLKNA